MGRLGLVVAMSVCVFVCLSTCLCVPFPSNFFRPLIGPQIVAGSTRQQTVDRINQVADRGDGDEDKDEDEDEIPSFAVLLTTSVKRFDVFCMQDF